jgi:hypothetical protein
METKDQPGKLRGQVNGMKEVEVQEKLGSKVSRTSSGSRILRKEKTLKNTTTELRVRMSISIDRQKTITLVLRASIR